MNGYYEALRVRKSRLDKAFSVDSHRKILKKPIQRISSPLHVLTDGEDRD